MTVKRVFLNLGIVLTLIAAFIFGIQQYDNSFLESTEGTVLSEYNGLDGFYNIKYHSDRTYIEAIYLPEANVGDNITVLYNRRYPEKIAHKLNLWAFIGMLGIPGILMIICCCTAFKGYKTEFIDKMHKPKKFCIISTSASVILEFIFILNCYYKNTLQSLGLFLFVSAAILTIVPTANMFVRDKYKYNKNSDRS